MEYDWLVESMFAKGLLCQLCRRAQNCHSTKENKTSMTRRNGARMSFGEMECVWIDIVRDEKWWKSFLCRINLLQYGYSRCSRSWLIVSVRLQGSLRIRSLSVTDSGRKLSPRWSFFNRYRSVKFLFWREYNWRFPLCLDWFDYIHRQHIVDFWLFEVIGFSSCAVRDRLFRAYT